MMKERTFPCYYPNGETGRRELSNIPSPVSSVSLSQIRSHRSLDKSPSSSETSDLNRLITHQMCCRRGYTDESYGTGT